MTDAERTAKLDEIAQAIIELGSMIAKTEPLLGVRHDLTAATMNRVDRSMELLRHVQCRFTPFG